MPGTGHMERIRIATWEPERLHWSSWRRWSWEDMSEWRYAEIASRVRSLI